MSRASTRTRSVPDAPRDAKHTHFTVDGRTYRLRVWSDAEWSALPARGRPFAEHFPGLGWVGGEPVEETCRPRSRSTRGGPSSLADAFTWWSDARGPVRVLLVEDTEPLRGPLARFLRLRGHEVCEAEDGVAALGCLESFSPDVVVTDLLMPRLGGVGLIRQLRAMPGMAAVPVVATTAADSPELVREAMLAGASAFLAKPFDLSGLSDLISECGVRPGGDEDLVVAGGGTPTGRSGGEARRVDLAREAPDGDGGAPEQGMRAVCASPGGPEWVVRGVRTPSLPAPAPLAATPSEGRGWADRVVPTHAVLDRACAAPPRC